MKALRATRLPPHQAELAVPGAVLRPETLQAAYKACNYGGGAEVAVDNRMNRQLVDHYRQVIEPQQDEIDEFRRQLEERERPRPHRTLAIC